MLSIKRISQAVITWYFTKRLQRAIKVQRAKRLQEQTRVNGRRDV